MGAEPHLRRGRVRCPARGALLVAIVASNFPDALGSAVQMRERGEPAAVLLGFAGGAVLASLAVTVFPQGFAHGGPYVALATVAGFLVAYLISEV